MQFSAIYAFSIVPQKGSDKMSSPQGGALKVTPDLQKLLSEAFNKSLSKLHSSVDFVFPDSDTREHEVRSAVMDFAFKKGSQRTAALKLAQRLSMAADNRSPAALFVIAVHELKNKDVKAVSMWSFPREIAFQFSSSKSNLAKLEVLTDIFSHGSKMRKAAYYEGRDLRTEFLTGKVLDLQTSSLLGAGANYWIEDFLGARHSITPEAGTAALAKALKITFDKSTSEHQKKLMSAAVAVHSLPANEWSLESFAKHHFDDGELINSFLQNVPNDETKVSRFRFHKETFERILNFITYKLESNVFVSAPFGSVGKEVKIDEKNRTLSCEGKILDERIKSRAAW